MAKSQRAMSGFWLLLIAVVSIVTKANCQCSEDKSKNSETSHHCNQIYGALESALVSTDNLYVLRIAVYPTSQFNRRLLEVEYNIQLPDNGTFTTTLGWTDSGVFAAINPRTLFNLQLQTLYLPLRNLLLEPDTITLTLDIQNTEVLSNATTTDVADVLEILNARLLVYATMQAVLTDWDGTDIGYTWNVQNAKDALLPTVVLLTIPTVLVKFPILYCIFRKQFKELISFFTYIFLLTLQKKETKSPGKLSFLNILLYSLEIPAAILTCIECIASFILLFECQRFSCFVRAITAIGVSIVAVPVFFFSLLRKSDSFLVFSKALVALFYISSIPSILLIVVYPAMILCTIIIYFSVITSATVICSSLMFLFLAIRLDKKNDESCSGPGALPLVHMDHDANHHSASGTKSEHPERQKRNSQDSHQEAKEMMHMTWGDLQCKHAWILLTIIFSGITSLGAILLCLLLMQALLAGANSNLLLTIVLIIITAFVPGGVLYVLGKAINSLTFHEDETVYLMCKTKEGNLTEVKGPYKLKSKLNDKKCTIERKGEPEYIANFDDLLKDPPPCECKHPNTFCENDIVYLMRPKKEENVSEVYGPYKLKSKLNDKKCTIQREGEPECIANIDDLLKDPPKSIPIFKP